MISQKLVDGTNIGRAIGRLLDLVYAPSVEMRNIVGSTTSFFHTSMVVNPGSNDHLRIRKFIHKGLLSSLSKKQQNGKVSMNNAALGFDYKLSINMLMKQLYIAVQYFHILNRITLEEDCHVMYASKNTKNEYLTKTIDGELIDINKLEMNKMNSTKSIVSRQVRLKVLNHPYINNYIFIYIYIHIPIQASVKGCVRIQTAALLVTL